MARRRVIWESYCPLCTPFVGSNFCYRCGINNQREMTLTQTSTWFGFIDLLIAKKVRRGAFVFSVLFVLTLSLATIAMQLGEVAWAVCAFTWAWVFGFLTLHLRRKHEIAVWLSHNPDDLFWVHPADPNGLVLDQTFEVCGKVVLHMKNGCSFELQLDSQARGQLDEWRKKTEAGVRWGPWNDTGQEMGSGWNGTNLTGLKDDKTGMS